METYAARYEYDIEDDLKMLSMLDVVVRLAVLMLIAVW
jgi:hypothetical protein